MQLQVRYRIDAHRYEPTRGACRPGCGACALEQRVYTTAEAAIAAQPRADRARRDGDQSALDPPERRFEVVVVDLFA